MPSDITLLAKTNFRKKDQIFGIKRNDRRQHAYVVGKTGVGKTAFLKNMALQDIQNGEGLAIIDPHGEFVEEVLNSIPAHRINDVVYFNPADMEFPVSFNIMEVTNPEYKHLIASGLIGIFTKIWANVWSARMEYILANCILALLDTPGTTLLGIPRMLVDRDYRQKIVNNLTDPVVKSFWVNEYEEWSPSYRNEAIAPVQNKVGQFLNVSLVRHIVGQAKNTIDVDEIMNTGKILLVNVSKGRVGEDNSAILGAMVITKIQLAAMERVRIPEEERKDFYLYVDEFQNFATDSFVNILSEARKYRLNLIIAHQYVGQLVTETTTAVRDAVFGNVGTMVCFRVGAVDAEFLEQEFFPEFLQNDLIHLPNYSVYIKLMIDGITSRPFSAQTIAPPPIDRENRKRAEIIEASRRQYSKRRTDVEEEITKWAGNLEIQDSLINPEAPRMAQSRSQFRSQSSKGTTLYDAKCSNCGKWTKVIFPPEPGKPVYCKSCLKKIKPARNALPTSNASRSDAGWHSDAGGGKRGEVPQRVTIPIKDLSAQAGSKSMGATELEKLGIEFEPARNASPTNNASRSDAGWHSSGGSPQSSQKISSQGKIPTSSRILDGKAIGTETFSLNEITKKEPVFFSKKKKKEVNLQDLKKSLNEALKKEDDISNNNEKKKIQPEEEIKSEESKFDH